MSERVSVDQHLQCGLPPTSLSTSHGGSAGIIVRPHHRVQAGELANANKDRQQIPSSWESHKVEQTWTILSNSSSNGSLRNASKARTDVKRQCELFAWRTHQLHASTIYKTPACRMGGPVPREQNSKHKGPNLNTKPVSQAQRVRACTSAEGLARRGYQQPSAANTPDSRTQTWFHINVASIHNIGDQQVDCRRGSTSRISPSQTL